MRIQDVGKYNFGLLLQDKKVVTCEPDILSFNIDDHKMQFAVLASDGLWDTHTNEDAVSVITTRSQPSIKNNF